jgi:hypothetical protein
MLAGAYKADGVAAVALVAAEQSFMFAKSNIYNFLNNIITLQFYLAIY